MNEVTINNPRTKFQLLVLIIIIVLVGWTIQTSMQKNKEKKDKQVVIDRKDYILEDILKQVSKHVDIPKDIPLMATIDNASALKSDQVFYSDAADDDILLIFVEKAIIYRPSKDILVNVGPVIFAQP